MRRFISLLYKDYLLLMRDAAGLCLMFVMPVALVVLMTFLQNHLIGSISESKISVLVLNQDCDSLGNSIEKQITISESFIVEKAKCNADELKNSVARGDYMIGVVIPVGASDSIRRNAKNSVIYGFNDGTVKMADSVVINIYLDPTLKTSFRNTLMSTLNEFAAKTERNFLLQELMRELNKRVPFKLGKSQFQSNQVVFDVQYALMNKNATIPNATQHNVPAWALFAIFFIALSLSGGLIKEREDGSFKRLLIMPCSYFQYLLSKSVVYLAICLLQLALLFALGVYLFPYIGLPKLTLATNAWMVLPIGVCSSLAAIGFGLLVGKITNEYQQASVLAALSVIIFAAIGGIWVPIFAMPKPMQTISHISPMNWGLNGFYDILVRNGGFVDIWQECVLLLAFAALCMVVAVVYHIKKKF